MAGSEKFDWLAYKAHVAAIMLPHIYQQVINDTKKSAVGIRNPMDVAIDNTIELTIDMTERLERRLKDER